MCIISMYVLCLVFVTKYEDKFEISTLSYGCSGKGDKVNMRGIHALIHLYHILRSVLVDVNNM